MPRKTLLIDFDGVLHGYAGNFNPTLGDPLPSSRRACCILARTYRLVCFTSRPSEQVEPWLKKFGFPITEVTNIKLPAYLIIDDRAITFSGVWSDNLLARIKSFRPHWDRRGEEQVDSSEKEGVEHEPTLPPEEDD